jgi:hypothetical protein
MPKSPAERFLRPHFVHSMGFYIFCSLDGMPVHLFPALFHIPWRPLHCRRHSKLSQPRMSVRIVRVLRGCSGRRDPRVGGQGAGSSSEANQHGADGRGGFKDGPFRGQPKVDGRASSRKLVVETFCFVYWIFFFLI